MKKFLWIFIILLIVAFAFYLNFVAGNQLRAWRATKTSDTFVKKLYSDYSIAGQNCQGEDTNNDGYVTCNLRLKASADGAEKVITVQCPTFIKSYMGTSCKEQGLVINNQ